MGDNVDTRATDMTQLRMDEYGIHIGQLVDRIEPIEYAVYHNTEYMEREVDSLKDTIIDIRSEIDGIRYKFQELIERLKEFAVNNDIVDENGGSLDDFLAEFI